MTKARHLPAETVHHVRDTCLCLHAQRAARALARRFDAALQPVDLTNGQFSLLMSLNRSPAPRLGEVAALLAMDRTTLTAALKALERRDLVSITTDEQDRRSRRLNITDDGCRLLAAALTIWRAEHEKIARELPDLDADAFRAELRSFG